MYVRDNPTINCSLAKEAESLPLAFVGDISLHMEWGRGGGVVGGGGGGGGFNGPRRKKKNEVCVGGWGGGGGGGGLSEWSELGQPQMLCV